MTELPFSYLMLDLGGVVCRYRPQRRLTVLAAAAGLPEEKVHDLVWGSGFDTRCDSGELAAAESRAELRARLGLPAELGDDELERIWVLAFEPDDAVLDLVERARAATGVGTALLTDNGPLLLAALPRLLPRVDTCFDQLAFSCRLGVTKPAPEAFERALDLIGAAPGEVFFVDDSERNVTAARALGIDAERFVGADRLAQDLRARGFDV